jgi:AraC-like DNA-binding protein
MQGRTPRWPELQENLAMDPLSTLLQPVRLHAARYTIEELPAGNEIVPTVAPRHGGTVQAAYYQVARGNCVLRTDEGEAVELATGDVVLLLHGAPHRLTARSAAQLLCGELTWDPVLCEPLLPLIPRVIRIAAGRDGRQGWLQTLLVSCVATDMAEAHPGREGMLHKLSEVLLAETLRCVLAERHEAQDARLMALRDRAVSRCLALMGERLAHPWTVATLAREVNVSRSVLAQRFTELLGLSPMASLARWRMATAADLLRVSSMGLARVAQQVGYETESALSRAFRREYGLPPVAWRRAHQLADEGGAFDGSSDEATRTPSFEPAA